MAFNPNVPRKSDRLSVSQGDFLNNFESIYEFVDENHDTFGTPDEGKHKYVVMPNIPLSPNFPNDGENPAVFLSSNLSSLINIFFFSQAKIFPNKIAFGQANRNSGELGYAYIGNSLVKWGRTNSVPTQAGAFNVMFPVGLNVPQFTTVPLVFSTVLSVNVQGVTQNPYKLTGNASLTGFEVRKQISTNAYTIPFLAIGTF